VLDEIRRLAARPDVDAVILTPHWGNEYQQQPDVSQRRLAHEAIDAGATAIIGAHPHVLQPWEQYAAADGHEGLIVYSSGNFISSQLRTEQRSGLISLLELTRGADGRARLTAAGYVPTWVDFASPWRVLENTGTESAAALALTTRLLPPANRVRSGALGQLPKACGLEMVAGTTVPAGAQSIAMDAQATQETQVTTGDTTGSIAAARARPIKVSATAPAPRHAPRPATPARAPASGGSWVAGTGL
jgi:hypothetical protein